MTDELAATKGRLVYRSVTDVVITRMWANAHRDGRPAEYPNIGGALCSTPQSLADAHY